MALETTSLRQLDSTFRKFFSSKCFETLYRELSTELRDGPKQKSEYGSAIEGLVIPHGMKKWEKFLLLTSVWYYPKEPMRFQIILECEKLFGKEFENEYKVLCSSKTLALGFWLSQDSWNDRDFFGNVLRLRRNGTIFTLITVKREPTSKVEKYTGYCRGYSESGRYSPYRSKSVLKERLLSEEEQVQKVFLRVLKLTLLIKKIRERLRMEL